MRDLPAYRGSGDGRPDGIPLPPGAMPLLRAGRLLKRWRYVGFYSRELSLCVGSVRVGPLRQSFWAVWDRTARQLYERTVLRSGGVRVGPGRVTVRDPKVEIELRLAEAPGVEVVTPYGRGYVWTRKQGGIEARGTVALEGCRHELNGRAFIDDWAGYPPRRAAWLWSAGLGRVGDGAAVAWNLVVGINDGERDSERTVWIDSHPHEVGPVRFAPDLSAIVFGDGAKLTFASEAVRKREDNLLLIRSNYEQPFGAFSGRLEGGQELLEAYGVMERHQAVW